MSRKNKAHGCDVAFGLRDRLPPLATKSAHPWSLRCWRIFLSVCAVFRPGGGSTREAALFTQVVASCSFVLLVQQLIITKPNN